MNWAWPPSWAMPASNDARVRVELKKKSIARTLSRRSGCAIPRARLRLSVAATSRTDSISSVVHSDSEIRSRPRNPVCIAIASLLGLAQDEGEQGHAQDDAVGGLDPVALVARLVDVERQLVHARQGME